MRLKFLIVSAFVFCVLCGMISYAQDNGPSEIDLYTPLILSLPVDENDLSNPFDSREIEVLGIFTSPAGVQSVVPGFWLQPYSDQCPAPCPVADFQPSGEPVWQVRFTPREAGTWTYTLQIRRDGAVQRSEEGSFLVRDSDHDGFIRVGENRRYFAFDSGKPYLPVGMNLKWSWDGIGGVRTYQYWLRDLSASGVNYARLFIDTPWFIGLDWAGPAGDYRQAQRAAAELDVILDTAAQYGIALQLVLLWNQSMRVDSGPPVLIPEEPARPNMSADWDDHPYNVLNGGPLSGPGAFFANPQAQELIRRRLRYIMARWGYSPQVFAWEIVDRIDRLGGFSEQVAGEWLRSTIAYLREIDTHDHLITAGSQQPSPLIFDNPLLDFTSFEFYQRRPIEATTDQESEIIRLTGGYLAVTQSPLMLNAFSLNPWYEPVADDPQGVHFQSTLWTSLLSGTAGTAASDWWDTYIIARDLQRYFAPVAAFAAGIDWPNLKLEPVQASMVFEDENDYSALRLTSFDRRFAFLPRSAVLRQITPDGVFPDLSDQTSYLYGQVFNTQFSQVQRYQIVAPADTYLEVRVRAVSDQAGASLVVIIDGETAATMSLRAGSRDSALRLPLKTGEHIVELNNTGSDWLELDYIEIGRLISPARALTLRDPDAGIALAWMQHRDYTWETVAAGTVRNPISAIYRLNRMPPGRYVVEIWDPLGGGVLGEEILRVADDGWLAVNLLPFDSQVALRILRQAEAATDAPTELLVSTTPEPPPATDTMPTTAAPPTATPSPSRTPTSTWTATVTLTPTITPTPFPSAAVTVFRPSQSIRATMTPAAPLIAVTNTPRPSPTPQS